jgi:hypothetical protein
MKMFLTEFKDKGISFSGPNIIAETLELAKLTAEAHGLIITGEFNEIHVSEDSPDYTYVNKINEDDITIH